MVSKSNSIIKSNYFLQSGFIFVPLKETFISTVLGSCVSVCIYDRKRKTGGMNHFQFPSTKERYRATACYGNVATIALINMLINDGSKRKHMEAQVYGGAFNPQFSIHDIGEENVMVAKKVLARNRIRIVSEDVGGRKGRKIVFNTTTNEIGLFKVDKLRKGDWYPYENDR